MPHRPATKTAPNDEAVFVSAHRLVEAASAAKCLRSKRFAAKAAPTMIAKLGYAARNRIKVSNARRDSRGRWIQGGPSGPCARLADPPIQRTHHTPSTLVQDVGVNHRRGHIRVAQ